MVSSSLGHRQATKVLRFLFLCVKILSFQPAFNHNVTLVVCRCANRYTRRDDVVAGRFDFAVTEDGLKVRRIRYSVGFSHDRCTLDNIIRFR